MSQRRTCGDSKDWMYGLTLPVSAKFSSSNARSKPSVDLQPVNSKFSVIAEASKRQQITSNNWRLRTHLDPKTLDKSDSINLPPIKDEPPVSFLVYKKPELLKPSDTDKPVKKLRQPSTSFLMTHPYTEENKSSSDEDYQSAPTSRPLFNRSHKVLNSDKNLTKATKSDVKVYVPPHLRKDSNQNLIGARPANSQIVKEFDSNQKLIGLYSANYQRAKQLECEKGPWTGAIFGQSFPDNGKAAISKLETDYKKKPNVQYRENNNVTDFNQNVMTVNNANVIKKKQLAQERLVHLKSELVKSMYKKPL